MPLKDRLCRWPMKLEGTMFMKRFSVTMPVSMLWNSSWVWSPAIWPGVVGDSGGARGGWGGGGEGQGFAIKKAQRQVADSSQWYRQRHVLKSESWACTEDKVCPKTRVEGLHSESFHHKMKLLGSARHVRSNELAVLQAHPQMSLTASLSGERLSLSVFPLFCSVLLEITSRDKSVFLYFCLLTRCQEREGAYSSQGEGGERMYGCIARTPEKHTRAGGQQT